MKKKQVVGGGADAKNLASLDSVLLRTLAPLVEHCAVRRYDDGEPREPGWFMVATSGAAWRVTVKDPDGCCSFAVIADTVDTALETAALMLSCDEAPWKPDSFLAAAAAKKKKK